MKILLSGKYTQYCVYFKLSPIKKSIEEMTNKCKKCGKEISEINLTEEQKYYLYRLLKQDLKLFAIHKIKNDFELSQEDAERVIDHMNNNGECVNCDFKELKKQKGECPKCGAFYYNLVEPNIDKELSSHPEWSSHFCSHLEWNLDFESLNNNIVKGFWCDGVQDFFGQDISINKEVITKAWIGKTGQDVYRMKIKFGDESIKNFKLGLSLIDCIPKEGKGSNWIKIDTESRQIEVEIK